MTTLTPTPIEITIHQPEVGDYAPTYVFLSNPQKSLQGRDFIGKSVVLFFYLKDGSPTCTAEVCGFRELYSQFQKLNIEVIGVAVDSPEAHDRFAQQCKLPFPLISDANMQISGSYGTISVTRAGEQATLSMRRKTYLIDPAQRIVKIYDRVEDPMLHAPRVLADARELLAREEPRNILAHAPVLLIPNVLPRELCQELIRVWETEGNEDSGFMRQVDGQTVGIYDYSHKIRRDHFLKPGPTLDRVRKYISARVVPELNKAFNYDATRFEDIRIACYDAARGGYFRPHRDNTTEGTAHRRFAISLLLNDDYQGGYLRFAEFAPHLYRPEAGGAVVFSSSLIHEATDITAGRRFVLLTFFYGEREAKIREEYNIKTGGPYRSAGN